NAGGTFNQAGTVDVKDFTTTAGSPNGIWNQTAGTFSLYHDFKSSGTFNGTGGTVQFAGAGGGATFPSTLGPTQFNNVLVTVDPAADTNGNIRFNVGGNWTANVASGLNAKPTTVVFNGSG